MSGFSPSRTKGGSALLPFGGPPEGPVRPAGYTESDLASRVRRRYTPPQEASEFQITIPADFGSITMDVAVAQYCATEGLTEYVVLATELLHRHFPVTGPVTYACDAGWPDEGVPPYVGIQVIAHGDVPDLGDRYLAYYREWTAATTRAVDERVRLQIGYAPPLS